MKKVSRRTREKPEKAYMVNNITEIIIILNDNIDKIYI